MVATTGIDNLTLNVTQEIRVRATLETTFVALLEQGRRMTRRTASRYR